MRRRGNARRRVGVILLLISLLLPFATTVRADGPAVASLSIPVGPGALTSANQRPVPRLAGHRRGVRRQPQHGPTTADPGHRQERARCVRHARRLVKQGANTIRGIDVSTGKQFSVPVGDGSVPPSVSGHVAWLAQNTNGVAVLAGTKRHERHERSRPHPADRLQQEEALGPPRVSGRRLMFPDHADPPASAGW